jgi:hypothetical protein
LLVLLALEAPAEMVRDLYAAQVPVSGQDSRALASASRDAMSEVLVKVTGSEEVLSNPGIATALGEARQHVQQYAYVRDDSRPGELSARFEFDGSYITRLVTEAREPLWTANRPRVLVWMVLERDGERQFVSADTEPELAAELVTAFARRGVPLQLPLFDLADYTALSVDELWRLYQPSLLAASRRYEVEDVLAGRAVALSSGEWVGDWSYLYGGYGGDRLDRSISAPLPAGFLRDGVAMVAEAMAARYAVAPSGNSGDGLRMSVSGVASYADYAAVVSWLEGLELVEHANVERLAGDQLELRLQAQADAAQLASVIELNDRLRPLPPASAQPELAYQWLN